MCKKISYQQLIELVEAGCTDWLEAAKKSGATRYCGNCIKQFRGVFQQVMAQKNRQIAA